MTKARRARRSRQEWHRLVAQYEMGKVDQKEFCQREGLNPNTFRLWRSRVRSTTNGIGGFVEVVPASAPSASPGTAPTSPWLIEVELPSGATLRMRG